MTATLPWNARNIRLESPALWESHALMVMRDQDSRPSGPVPIVPIRSHNLAPLTPTRQRVGIGLALLVELHQQATADIRFGS